MSECSINTKNFFSNPNFRNTSLSQSQLSMSNN